MSYELIVTPEATIEMQKAFERYEFRKEGDGFDLVEEIEDGFDRISKHPHHYSAISDKYRKLRINRFPYLIIFEIGEGQVTIIAFRDVRQDNRF